MNFLKNYFLSKNRMNRKPFFNVFLLVCLMVAPVNFYLMKDAMSPEYQQAMLGLIQQESSGKVSQAEYDVQMQALQEKLNAQMPQTAIFIVGLITSLLLLPAFIMRLKDLNYSPWLALLNVAGMVFGCIHVSSLVIMLVNISAGVLGFVLLLKRGTQGPNLYGRDPLDIPAHKAQFLGSVF